MVFGTYFFKSDGNRCFLYCNVILIDKRNKNNKVILPKYMICENLSL